MVASSAKKISYDYVYPYHIKFCSMTRLHPKTSHGKIGGSPGHAVMYIKGACPLHGPEPSRLRVCDINEDYGNPDLGVGISTNKYLKNVNFVVIPGQKLFLVTPYLLVKALIQWRNKKLLKTFKKEHSS